MERAEMIDWRREPTIARRRLLQAACGAAALAAFPVLAIEGSVNVARFPRYATEMNPSQRELLKWYSEKLVDAAGRRERVQVLIIGHADFDAQGREFERKVSEQRAASALKVLQTQVAEIAQRKGINTAGLISFKTEALGTREPIFDSPKNERQRLANRRVEIVWQSTAPAPKPIVPVESTTFEIRVVGGFSAAVLAQADNYFFQIVDLTKRQTAFFYYTGGGVGVSIPKIPGPGSATKAGPPAFFRTTGHTELHQFNSKASLFQDPGATAGSKGVGGTLRLSIEEILDSRGLLVSTRPSIIPIAGGPGIQMPGLGSVTTGVLALHSAVFPFNGY